MNESDRRFSPRYVPAIRTTVKMKVYGTDEQGSAMQGLVCDSSTLGLAIRVDRSLSIDDLLLASIPLLNDAPGMEVLYRVVRCEPDKDGWKLGAEVIEFEPSQ